MAAIAGSKRPRMEDDEINPSCENDPTSGTDSVSEEKKNSEDFPHLDFHYDEEAGRKYHQQVKESEGFDVDYYPTLKLLGGVIPLPLTEMSDYIKKEVEECCKAGTKRYNKDKHTNYKFAELVKATRRGVAGFMYYVTFIARDTSDGNEVTLQAEVWRNIEKESVVQFCRIKPAK